MDEARKHTRHDVLIAAEAEVAGKMIPVTIIEISLEGLRLQSKKFFAPNSILPVVIVIGRKVIFNGWVIWVLDSLLPDGNFYHSGIEIDSIVDAASGMVSIHERAALIEEIIDIARRNK
jgi:hypothetical protein